MFGFWFWQWSAYNMAFWVFKKMQPIIFLNKENNQGARTENPKPLPNFFHSGRDKTSLDVLF